MKLDNSKKIYYVASYPKSGATWFRFLMYGCKYGKLESSAEVNYFYRTTPNHDHKILDILKKEDSLFLKSHLPFHEHLTFLDDIKVCIYIARNPFNAILSRVDHYILEGLDYVDTPEGKTELIRSLIDIADSGMDPDTAANNNGGWNYHVTSWLETNRSIPVYLIRYEDLLEHTFEVIVDMNQQLELGFTEENILRGCELASFENMRKLEIHEIENEIIGSFFSPTRKRVYSDKQVQFVNKGKKRNYEEELGPEWIEKGMKAFEKGMRLAGYL
ncbi:MAG: hypothetical protein RI973_5 [Bacteroidota bacterium]|jgi:hypothetical protein